MLVIIGLGHQMYFNPDALVIRDVTGRQGISKYIPNRFVLTAVKGQDEYCLTNPMTAMEAEKLLAIISKGPFYENYTLGQTTDARTIVIDVQSYIPLIPKKGE